MFKGCFMLTYKIYFVLAYENSFMFMQIIYIYIYIFFYIGVQLFFQILCFWCFVKKFYLLFIYYVYFWLCWVFVSVWGLSPVAASGGHSSSRCTGLSLSWPLLLWSTGSRRAGSVIVAHGPSCSAACGIFPDQGSNPWPLHWQADSQPLRHQGSPMQIIFAHVLEKKKKTTTLNPFLWFTNNHCLWLCYDFFPINLNRNK